MKSYNHLFEKVVQTENIKKAIMNASRRKRTRNDVAKILADIDREAEFIREMLIKERYIPGHGRKHIINEDSSKKNREIVKPHFAYDQIIHHAVIQVMEPIFLHGMYEYVYGSVPRRGSHKGAKRIRKWMMSDQRGTKYCFKYDIRHFYASVDKEILKGKLQRIIRDDKMLRLLFRIIDGNDPGIPLGYYTSQWFANFYLQDLDHYIKQELHAKYYVRYADDMVIFGPNKKDLHKMQAAIELYLNERLHLRMKRDWQVFRTEFMPKPSRKKPPRLNPDGSFKKNDRKLDYMGFLFDHEHLTLRKSSMITATQKAARINRKKKVNWFDATAMLSHLGKFNHTETRKVYEDRVKPYIDVKKLKKIVSVHQRKENDIERAKLESARRISDGKTSGRGHRIESNDGIPSPEH
ncbi:MAG: RNA-directed DNA polymerase [Lachnospiraceae bacterium]|nr:RNA-directed DNA polymerase [Lachnospiraceae bacterium]